MCVVQVFNVKRRLSYIRHNTQRIASDNAASREPALAQNRELKSAIANKIYTKEMHCTTGKIDPVAMFTILQTTVF